MQRIVDQARKNDGVPRTAQQSIPFDRMFPDGICRVGDNYYTRMVQFQDINYQLAQQEDKTAIFEEWCSFLNFFDSSVHFELSFVNLATDAESFEKSIREHTDWLKEVSGRSDFRANLEISAYDRVITLSTCAYRFENARYVLHGKLMELQ